MDPDGITDCLLSSDPEAAELEFFSQTKATDFSMDKIHDRRHAKDPNDTITKFLSSEFTTSEEICSHPVSIVETNFGSVGDCSTVGSNDVLSCGCDETSSVRTFHHNTKSIFREFPHNFYNDRNNTIIIPVKTSSMNASTFDDDTTLYLCNDTLLETCSSNEDIEKQHMVKNGPDNGSAVRSVNAADSDTVSTQDNRIAIKTLSSIKIQSIFIGSLIGLFIQFSTLGANFLVSSYNFDKYVREYQLEQQLHPVGNITFTSYDQTKPSLDIVQFNLGWSVLVSLLGICFMSTIRALLSLIDKKNRDIMLHMECFIAVGALIGVCVAWIGTDGLLDVHGHLILSVVTLGAALFWCKIVSALLLPRSENELNDDGNSNHEKSSTLREPLMSTHYLTYKSKVKDIASSEKLHSQIKFLGSILGLLVGVFIQFSSLGSNFLLQSMYGLEVTSTQHLQLASNTTSDDAASKLFTDDVKVTIVRISFIWSLVSSFIGVLLLILVRTMVSNFFKAWNVRNNTRPCLTRYQDTLILGLECSFAIGSTFGLNVSWTFTDYVLGLESHMVDSVLTLVGTILWCKAVRFCFGHKVSSLSLQEYAKGRTDDVHG